MYGQQQQVRREFDKKAWFLCKFLCRELSEENFELARAHVSGCVGTKTKVKLNANGWTVGTSMMKKAFVDYFPLSAIDNLCQDTQFVNVVFVILQLAETPAQIDQKYEILAYKLRDQTHARMFQNVFQALTGQRVPIGLSLMSTSMGNLTLVPNQWRNQSRSGSVAGGLDGNHRRPTNGNAYIYDQSEGKRNIRYYGSQDEVASQSVGSSNDGGQRSKHNGDYNMGKRVVKGSIDSPDQSWSQDESWAEKNSKWSNGVVSSRNALSSESSYSGEEMPSTIYRANGGNPSDLYYSKNRNVYPTTMIHQQQFLQQRQRGMLEVPESQYRPKGMTPTSSRSDVYNDAASMRSNNVFLLNPKFKKSYVYRR